MTFPLEPSDDRDERLTRYAEAIQQVSVTEDAHAVMAVADGELATLWRDMNEAVNDSGLYARELEIAGDALRARADAAEAERDALRATVAQVRGALTEVGHTALSRLLKIDALTAALSEPAPEPVWDGCSAHQAYFSPAWSCCDAVRSGAVGPCVRAPQPAPTPEAECPLCAGDPSLPATVAGVGCHMAHPTPEPASGATGDEEGSRRTVDALHARADELDPPAPATPE